MRVLFIFCEGPHDAHFVGRLLKASGLYLEYITPLKDYPRPLDKFISLKFQNRKIEDIRIGKPDNPLVPVCGLIKGGEEVLVFPISLGGMDKINDTRSLLSEIYDSFAPDILVRPESDVSAVSILFIYDADSRGYTHTVQTWNAQFADLLPGEIPAAQWTAHSGLLIGLFVFTGADGDTGTLEDNLIVLFRSTNEPLITRAETFVDDHFEPIAPGGDGVAYATKKKKGILTICGQAEKKNAGYALTMVVRDTDLLNDAFDFANQEMQWTKLLNLINGAFE